MNDLPDSASPAGTNNPTNTPIIQSGTGVGSISKEIEGGVGLSEAGLHDVSGQEMELPKEVAAVGVKVQPTTVTIPQPVAQMGVISAGTNVPAAPAVALPLTDDQIAVGLKASITSSIRWLAEWCVLRLKQLHKKIIKSP